MHPTDHGSRSCYQHGCRQPSCVAANRRYAAAHQRRRRAAVTSADLVWVPYLPAGPVRRHIRLLADAGVSLRQIAAVSGVSYRALRTLMVGDRARKGRRSRTVTPRVANAVLRVTADSARRRLIPSGPTVAILAEFAAAGVPRARIARAVGRADLRLGTTVEASVADRIVELHRLLLVAA